MATPPVNVIDWETLAKNHEKFKKVLEIYLSRVTPEGAPPAHFEEGYHATAPLRADSTHGAGGSPLKLLSLGKRLTLYVIQDTHYIRYRWWRCTRDLLSRNPGHHRTNHDQANRGRKHQTMQLL